MRAWKFLDERSMGIFSRFRWPTPASGGEPGPWVEAAKVVPCEQGVHACTSDDLAWWMSAQLWEIELDGPVRADQRKIVARRGRLVSLVSTWPPLGTSLAAWAVWRVRDNAVELLDAYGSAATAAELAAVTVTENLAATAAAVVCDPHSAVGIALAQLIDASNDLGNPILACVDAARSAGHLASADDNSVATFTAAFAAERLTQSRWITAELALDR